MLQQDILVAIEKFIADHQIEGEPHEIVKPSELYPTARCYEVCLAIGPGYVLEYEYFYTYESKETEELPLAVMLWHLAEEAAQFGGHGPYGHWRWLMIHDAADPESTLGRKRAEMYYEYCRKCYYDLIELLGEQKYQELIQLIRKR